MKKIEKNQKVLYEYLSDYDYNAVEVILIKEKLAVTQAKIKLSFKEENVSAEGCERIVWLHYPDGWYVQDAGRTCVWMPDESRIKFLTQNVPGR